MPTTDVADVELFTTFGWVEQSYGWVSSEQDGTAVALAISDRESSDASAMGRMMKVDAAAAAATAAMVSSFIVFIVKVLQCPRSRVIELWLRNHRSEEVYSPFVSWAGDGDIAGMYSRGWANESVGWW